jgi:hypothetical protein
MAQLTTRLEDFGLVTVQYKLGRETVEIPFFTDKHGNKHIPNSSQYNYFYDEIIDWESDSEDYLDY